jgi:hypothetical protein
MKFSKDNINDISHKEKYGGTDYIETKTICI